MKAKTSNWPLFPLLLISSAAAIAQGKAPVESAPEFTSQLSNLALRGSELVSFVNSVISTPFGTWAGTLANLLALLVLGVSFLRLLRKNNGGTIDLAWLIGRFGLCLILLTFHTQLIGGIEFLGQRIATGEVNSAWAQTLHDVREDFDKNYADFTRKYFLVNNNLGVLETREAGAKDFQREASSHGEMPTLLGLLSFARGLLEFMDFGLLLLPTILLLFIQMLAPLAIALGVDPLLTRRFSQQFGWAVAIILLVFPVASELTRLMVYKAAALLLTIGAGASPYTWNQATISVITAPTAQPMYTIILVIAGLSILGVVILFPVWMCYKLVVAQPLQQASNLL